ncbi:hypothetical protein AMK59_4704, partial [Oryctes borbonicus]
EPNVQARQYQGNKGVTRHQAPMLMTPLEISMYVLLATFCFAIVVFVVSCVVYASKFKPSEVGIDGMRAAPVSSSNSVTHRDSRKPRETTTNVHDWVWLGRATLDHSNRNSTVNNNTTEMRITTNPLNMNYCEPEDCVVTSFSNPTHIELPSRPAENPPPKPVIDSSTYCKSKSGRNPSSSNTSTDELEIWNKPTPPPPLPPHGIPQIEKQKEIKKQDVIEEYKPPVPPHRNIGITTQASSVEASPTRKHHHHHHHRNARPQLEPGKSKYESRPQPEYGNRYSTRNDEIVVECEPQEPKRSVFEFDDDLPVAPVSVAAANTAAERQSPPPAVIAIAKSSNNNEQDAQFVQYSKSPTRSSLNPRNSGEIKKATIIGNPMYSTEDQPQEENTAELSGLDGLQLDMDYDQIMHYFENLKESNA